MHNNIIGIFLFDFFTYFIIQLTTCRFVSKCVINASFLLRIKPITVCQYKYSIASHIDCSSFLLIKTRLSLHEKLIIEKSYHQTLTLGR